MSEKGRICRELPRNNRCCGNGLNWNWTII